jgi:hypothetical protein
MAGMVKFPLSDETCAGKCAVCPAPCIKHLYHMMPHSCHAHRDAAS